MADQELTSPVDRFIVEQIDSVPHLEALLLVWRTRPKKWDVEEMAKALYVKREVAERVLEQLTQRSLIRRTETPGDQYFYEMDAARDSFMEKVGQTYRQELVRISRLIHSKASVAVHDFARAFRFKKD